MALVLRRCTVGGLPLRFRGLSTGRALHALEDDPEGRGPWNYIWKPAPYPKTEEERLKAAHKYGMIPEDYVPMPDNGDGVGDYPDLGKSSMDSRSGHVAWDFPNLKRNYGEPMHMAFLQTMDFWGLDDTTPQRRSLPHKFAVFLGFVLFAMGAMSAFPEFQISVPRAEKQLIQPNVTHYTFEPLDD